MPQSQKQQASQDLPEDALAPSKGTSSPAEQPQAPKETASFTLRVPHQILSTLDDHLKKQPYKVPRQQWILEAIVQRLEREILAEYLPE